MNTITTTQANPAAILSTVERDALYRTWREVYATRTLAAEDFILYAILRGKNPKAGFGPITNAVKLANGQLAWAGYAQALAAVSYKKPLASKLSRLFPEMGADRHHELCELVEQAVSQLRKEA